MDPNQKPIPFRKPRRRRGDPLVRPTARIIPAGTLVVRGEVTIRTFDAITRQRAA